ncbi:MAG: Asp-tRNA(Asn)/Glu-tRNA(Gln) amidotransferase subunit GatC [Verrucomicrobiales bacterium]
MEKVLGYVQKIESLDVDGIEPTAHAILGFDALREDAERPSLDREAVLGNAPKRTAEEFVTPKVVEGA